MKTLESLAVYVVVGTLALLFILGVLTMLIALFEINKWLCLWAILFFPSLAYATTKGDLT
jgi:hypothetical protein